MANKDRSSRHDSESPDYAHELAHDTLRLSVSLSARTALLLIGAALAASWAIVSIAGGADQMVPHWYYVPILFAAARFGSLGAVAAALVAGVLAGPLTYVDVAASIPQETARWVTRTGFFLGIGLLMAWLVKPSMHPILEQLRRLRQSQEIRRGLTRGEFFLQYHPIYSVRDQDFTGVEALIRWQHPTLGHLSPDYFIGVAEESTLIYDLSDFVIDEACRRASEWQSIAQSHDRRPWYVAVNLSARDTERPDLAQRIEKSLKRHGLPAELLHVELTESILANKGSESQLRQLKEIGVTLAIDDFGVGYSSLSYLHRFPADVLKIDKSLVSELETSSSNRCLAEGMVKLASSLGLSTVAEGIETAKQLEIGTAMGFDYVQGFYFSRPLYRDQIQDLLSSGKPVMSDGDETSRSRAQNTYSSME